MKYFKLLFLLMLIRPLASTFRNTDFFGVNVDDVTALAVIVIALLLTMHARKCRGKLLATRWVWLFSIFMPLSLTGWNVSLVLLGYLPATAFSDILRLWMYVTVFFSLYSFVPNHPESVLRGQTRFFVASALVLYSAYALISFFIFGKAFLLSTGFNQPLLRLPVGFSAHPNALSVLLGFLLLATAILLDKRRWLHLGYLLALPTLILIKSRSTFVGLIAGLAASVKTKNLLRVATALVLLVIVGIAAGFYLQQEKGSSSILWRLEIWQKILAATKVWDLPLGQGSGAVSSWLAQNAYLNVTEPHNDYIRFLFNYGIVGLITYFGMVLKVYGAGRRHQAKWYGQIAMMGAPYLLLVSVTENVFVDTNASVWMWGLMGMAYGICRVRFAEERL